MVRHHPVTIWPIIGLLLGQWGCAMHPYHLPPPSEQLRAHLGTVGVASQSVVPEAAFQGPTSGIVAGAAKGAGLGAQRMLLGGLEAAVYGRETGVVVLALAIGLAPVAALVGGIYGAVEAEPAEKIKEAETALRKAVADLKVQEAIRDQILQAARDHTGHRLVLADRGVDTILEVSVPSVALAGPAAVNPPLSLFVQACPRLIRGGDGAELYPPGEGPRALVYASAPRKFVEWGAEDARLFRDEMERAYQSLAETIVEDVFLVYLPPGRRWTASGPGPLRMPGCPPTGGKVAQ